MIELIGSWVLWLCGWFWVLIFVARTWSASRDEPEIQMVHVAIAVTAALFFIAARL